MMNMEMIKMIQPHIKVDNINKYVLLPGDPGRIDKISAFLKDFREIKYNREYRICEGYYEDARLSMMSSGIGCPAAAIAIEELSNVGAKTIIRIGTCGGLIKGMQPGDIVIPYAAQCLDGTTREYDPSIEQVQADRDVVSSLIAAAKDLGVKYFFGINRTHDAFYEPIENFIKLEGKRFVSSEMECSAVFLISRLKNIRAGAILVVNTPEVPEEVRDDPDIIYRLVDEKKVQQGMDNAIKISLEAIKKLRSI